MWLETITALGDAIDARPTPKPACEKLVFVTRIGNAWSKDVAGSPETKEFRKVLDALKLHRPGLGFYTLRHTFETICGASLDQVATNHIMGHVVGSMAGVYREKIDDKRLPSVTTHVRKWL